MCVCRRRDDVRSYQSCSRVDECRVVASTTSRFRHPPHARTRTMKQKKKEVRLAERRTEERKPRSSSSQTSSIRRFVIRQMSTGVGRSPETRLIVSFVSTFTRYVGNEQRRGKSRGGAMCRVLNPGDLSTVNVVLGMLNALCKIKINTLPRLGFFIPESRRRRRRRRLHFPARWTTRCDR